jgi:glycosyltransferase involved in cell wall biosynthesis
VRIVIASFTFPPEVGGVAEVARTQAAGLADRGHDITIATTFHPQRADNDAPRNVAVRQFNVSGSFLTGRGYRGEISAYHTFIATVEADVLLFHGWQNWIVDTALPVLAKSSAQKILLSHGFDAHLRKPSPRFPWGFGSWLRARPYVWRLPKMLRAFDRIVFLSAQRDAGRFYDALLANAICPERVSIIPNGVHLDQFRLARPDFRKAHGIETRFLALNVANYDDRKNQLATLADFMAANRDDTTLVFIGGEFNAYHVELIRAERDLCKRFPKARVKFLEKIPKDTIYAAYQAADLFLLSAKQETQPLAILDAMAAGVPFVSTDVGCVREFPGGLIARSGPETTAAINLLLEDEKRRRELGREGRAACEATYNWERVLDDYEKLFRTLADK